MTSSSSSSPEISAATSTDSQDRFSYKHATHDEVLEDLSSRFILNLPDEELASLERICFQVEQAHWFYEDFIREENPKFPSLPLKRFSAMLFHACPLLHHWSHDHEQAFNTFMQYKTRVPVCGAIMLNDTWEKCLLVKGWKSSSGWGFPKGKINEDESAPNCAVREVLEETGYNLAGKIDHQNVIEMSIREQKISLFIVPGVPEDYEFKTKTRKEISKIEWFRLTDLPTWKRNKTSAGRFYLISPFIGSLKTFIHERKPRHIPRKALKPKKPPPGQSTHLRKESLSHASYNDTIHESSSQSSSAENGEPQTPSPHTTESLVNSMPQVVDDDVTKSEISAASIDPHFARLLDSLTMSASMSIPSDTNDREKRGLAPPLSIQINEHDCKDPGTPVPVTTSSTDSHMSLDSPDRIDWSASAPKLLSEQGPLPSSQVPNLHISSLNYRGSSTSPTSLPQNLRSPHSLSPGPCLNNAERKEKQFPPLSVTPSPSNPATSPTNTVASPRTTTSRRTSSITDISPYLSRAAEVPVSAKMLKQIALLESVADESARMSPFLDNRGPVLGTPINGANLSYKYSTHSAPPPPHLTTQHSNDLRGVYAPDFAGQAAVTGPSAPMTNGSFGYSYDPFQVRSRTSHTFHRSLPQHLGSASMNQSQLLTLVNGPRATPAPTQHDYMQTGQTRGGHYPPFHTPMPAGMHPTAVQHPSSPWLSRSSFAPHSTFGTIPVAVASPETHATNAPHSGTNSLLSILNGARNSSGALGAASSSSILNTRL